MEDKQQKHKLLKAWFPIKERKHNTLAEKIPEDDMERVKNGFRKLYLGE